MPDVSFKTYVGFMRLSSRARTKTSTRRTTDPTAGGSYDRKSIASDPLRPPMTIGGGGRIPREKCTFDYWGVANWRRGVPRMRTGHVASYGPLWPEGPVRASHWANRSC